MGTKSIEVALDHAPIGPPTMEEIHAAARDIDAKQKKEARAKEALKLAKAETEDAVAYLLSLCADPAAAAPLFNQAAEAEGDE